MNDLLPHRHGDEGEGSTHSACPEMVEKLGGKVGCCTCNGHECKPTDNHKKILEEWKKLCSDHEFDYVNDGGAFILEKLQEERESTIQEIISKFFTENGYMRDDTHVILDDIESLRKNHE